MTQNTNRFAEIPFYALVDYFTALGEFYKNEKESSSGAEFGRFSNVIFYKNSFIDWTGFLDWNGDYEKSHTYSSITDCRIVKPGHHQIVNGGQWTDLFVEKPSYGYREVRVRPKWWDKTWIDSNWFLFDLIEADATKEGIWTNLTDLEEDLESIESPVLCIELNDSKYSVIEDIVTNGEIDYKETEKILDLPSTDNINISKSSSEKSFAFKNYLKSHQKFSIDAELVPEDTFFFRKDSFFFDWFEKTLADLGTKEIDDQKYDSWNHRDFINPNVRFTYFGMGQPIHGDVKSWQIQHYSMKNFMINALPPNDLWSANYVTLWETYDRVYEEGYNMQRNITRLLDPDEVQNQYLPYEAAYYDVALSYRLSNYQQREFIKNLPTLLKKKGTQASLAVIWRTIIGSANKATFYERWHEQRIKKAIAVSSFSLAVDAKPAPSYEGTLGIAGGLPAQSIGIDFPNPLNLLNYVVLYCYGSPDSMHAIVYFYWERNKIYKLTFQKTYVLEAWKAQTSRLTQTIGNWTYFTGLEEVQFEVKSGQSSEIIEDGIIIEYNLDRREATQNEIGGSLMSKDMPDDSVARFYANRDNLKQFNSNFMVELSEIYPMMGNYFGRIEIEKNTANVSVFWDSGEIPLREKYETAYWLNLNFIRNYCYKNYFGFGSYSYKFDKLIKTETINEKIVTYWSIKRIPINYNLINWFVAPSILTGSEFAINSIMFSFTEPKYFVKLIADLTDFHNSVLEIWWNNECILSVKCPPELNTFNEMKFWAQNYKADISTKRISGTFLAWPKFSDRLDDMIGAEMESQKEGNTIIYWYKVRVRNLTINQ